MATSEEIVAIELDRHKRLDVLYHRTEPGPETLMCQALLNVLQIPELPEPVSIHAAAYEFGIHHGYNRARRDARAKIHLYIEQIKIPCAHEWYNLPGNYTKKCNLCEMEQNIR